MAAGGLIDTGAILMLDRNDHWHERCADAFVNLRTPLATSVAVLTEVCHLIGNHALPSQVLGGPCIRGAVTVHPIDDADLPALEALMSQYADRPMDFADATLVRLAERERLSTIFTIDHDDFETYRIEGRRRSGSCPSGEPPRRRRPNPWALARTRRRWQR